MPGDHCIGASVCHFPPAVDGWFRQSAVAPPMQTRQRLAFLTPGILLSGAPVLHRIASALAYLTPQTTRAARYERWLRRVRNAPRLTRERRSAPLARQILMPYHTRRWVVIIDATTHTEPLRVVTAARWERGRRARIPRRLTPGSAGVAPASPAASPLGARASRSHVPRRLTPHRSRCFGKPLRAISRFSHQNAQTPPSPLVGEGGRRDAHRGRFFGKPLRAISRFSHQDAQTPPSPLVGEGGRGG